MHRGYIKLWRKSLESRVWQNAELWQLWCYCLLKATHKPCWTQIKTGKGYTEIFLKEGQFIFGRKKAAKKLKKTESGTYKRLKKLEMLGNLNTQNKNHFTLVNICNWEDYQDEENIKKSKKEHPSNTQVTPKEHPSNTYKNGKHNKNGKNIILSFEEWQKYTLDSLNSLLSDIEWIKKMQEDYPDLNIKRTIEKAFEYFSSEDGYKNRKGNPNCNWKNTMNYQLGPKGSNRVFNHNSQETKPDYSKMP